MALVEKTGSRKVTITKAGLQAVRIFNSDWAERYGVAPKIGDPFPDLSGLFVSSVDIEGIGKNVVGGGYTKALITAQYDSPESSEAGQKTDVIYNQSIQFGGEMRTRAGGRWKDCKDPVKEDGIGGTFYPLIEYTFDMNVADRDEYIQKLRKVIGKVNSDVWAGGDIEHWLFQGANMRDITDETGRRLWVVSFNFVYNEKISWQKGWHVECAWNGTNIDRNNVRARWEELQFKPEDGGDEYTEKLYETTAFNEIVSDKT